MTRIFLILMAFLLTLQNIAFADEEQDRPPAYEQAVGSKAFGVRVAFNKFPIKTALGPSYQLFGDYMLPWQDFGVISVGAHLGLIPLSIPDAGDNNAPILSNTILGAQAGYQFKYWKNQPIIPTVAIAYEYFRIKPNGSSPSSTLTSLGTTFGVLISLNAFDAYTAKDAYETLKLTRSYLSIEVEPVSLTVSTSTASVPTGTSSFKGYLWFWGLRLEFE